MAKATPLAEAVGTGRVTRLNPRGPRAEGGSETPARRAAQAETAANRPARARPLGGEDAADAPQAGVARTAAVKAAAAKTGTAKAGARLPGQHALGTGPRGAGGLQAAAARRAGAATVVSVVPATVAVEEATVTEATPPTAQLTGTSVAETTAPAPAVQAAQVPAKPAVTQPVDTDEYADAVPLPARKAPNKAPAKREQVDVTATYTPAAAAKPAQMRKRHWGLLAFFFAMVILPAATYGVYLYTRAADQYESDVGFGSRTEDAPSPFAFLGALGGGGSSSSSDMDILSQFIISQELVSRVDKRLDLRSIFSKPANDPLMAFPKDGSIEDLVDYWQKMVLVNYDNGNGLISLRVFAFDPHDAQNIAKAVLDESTSIINELSRTAQADTTRYSEETLKKAEERMTDAQKALTDFRIKNHILDPQAQVAGTSQVYNTLVQQLGAAQIDLDMLRGTVPDNDPRIAQLNRRIEVIQNRMAEESSKVGGGLGDPNAPGYAELMVQYQNLQMEQDFSQKAYLTSLSAYDQAVNDAQHKTRYLTTYLSPTLAESPTAPNRPLRIFVALLCGFLAWSSITMIYYALRDRR